MCRNPLIVDSALRVCPASETCYDFSGTVRWYNGVGGWVTGPVAHRIVLIFLITTNLERYAMGYSIKHMLMSGSTALIACTLVFGCASKEKVEAVPAAQAAPAGEAVPVAKDRPSGAVAELLVINATVKAIDKKNRVVTLKSGDGKEVKVKCGPEVRNFPQIRVGDVVTAEFLETVELSVIGPQGEPKAEATVKAGRAPKGSKPGLEAVETIKVTAVVESIDYQTREVTLRGPEGKVYKITAGPQIKRFNEIKQGDTVAARYSQAVSIKVSTPAKKK